VAWPRIRWKSLRNSAQPIPQAAFSRKPTINSPTMSGGMAPVLNVARIEVQPDQLVIELTNAKGIGSKQSRRRNTLKVPWHKTPLRRRREILVPASVPAQDARAIRSETRALLISSIARRHRWLIDVTADPPANTS